MNTNLLGTLTGGAPVNNMGGITPQYLAVSTVIKKLLKKYFTYSNLSKLTKQQTSKTKSIDK